MIKRNILFQQIYEDISKNLVPIRPDRHYTRTKARLAGNIQILMSILPRKHEHAKEGGMLISKK